VSSVVSPDRPRNPLIVQGDGMRSTAKRQYGVTLIGFLFMAALVGGVGIVAFRAIPIYNEYFTLETDPAKKVAAEVTLGDIFRLAGDSEKAIAAYRLVLQGAPDNPEAMAGLGLSLFNSGVVASDKAQMQEGLNYMTKYTEIAPITATDTQTLKDFKTSVKEAVDYLKNTEKLAPQKVAPKKKGT